MTDTQERGAAVCGQTPGDEYLDTLAEQMPQMTRLFTALDAGATPNFLDIMAAISEMVAFYTDHDQIDEVDKILRERMSQKKCRFCS